VVLIPLVLLLVFKAPPILLLPVVGGLSYLCAREFVEIAKRHGFQPQKALLVTFLLLPYLVPPLLLFWKARADHLAGPFFALLAIAAPLVFLLGAMRRENLAQALPDAAVSLLGFLYIGIGLFSVWCLSIWPFRGAPYVLFLLVVVWSGDISAYYAGTRLGRRKLAARISPNKTWEGAVASFVVATGLGASILLHLNPIFDWLVSHHLVLVPLEEFGYWRVDFPVFPIWFALAASAIVNMAAQVGDLAESAIKRGADMKDSGNLLPGHGGVLDRVDALLFAGPVAMLVFALFDFLTARVVY
jgi:phosphatidate cytidylyltransferase